jgi:hypothetical protein
MLLGAVQSPPSGVAEIAFEFISPALQPKSGEVDLSRSLSLCGRDRFRFFRNALLMRRSRSSWMYSKRQQNFSSFATLNHFECEMPILEPGIVL